MLFIRKYIRLKLLWLIMASHILSISVDPPDPEPNHIPEDLSYNEMESIIEIILENVLAIEDAIPEQDDNDSSQGLLVEIDNHLVYFPTRIDPLQFNRDHFDLQKNIPYYNPYTEQFFPEIASPPPKA
jgi:hypothetical protein